MSKIYEALRKAAQDRERSRPAPVVRPPAANGDGQARPDTIDEDYQRLRANLLSIAVPSGLRSMLVTSSRHGEGTTTVALGLAGVLGRERDARVLLIEANLRRPSFAHLLPLTTDTGVGDFAAGRAVPEALVAALETYNFSVLPAGDARDGTVDLEIFDDLLARLRPQYDFIIIDGPPVNAYADASILSTKVDGVILVVEADQTPVAEAEVATRQLDKVGARVLGVVLNRRRSYLPAFLDSLL